MRSIDDSLLSDYSDDDSDPMEVVFENDSTNRMRLQGYSQEEVFLYKKAIRMRNDSMLESVPCRCTPLYSCVKCSIIKLRERYSPIKR